MKQFRGIIVSPFSHKLCLSSNIYMCNFYNEWEFSFTVRRLEKPLAGIDALRDLKAELISRNEVSSIQLGHAYFFHLL